MSDSLTMLRRELKHSARNPTTLISAFLIPVLMLLLLTYAFGGALDTHGVRFIDYVLPGILLLCACYATSTAAVAVSTDMAEGIIDRFRTMAIKRSSVLTGHVAGSVLRTLLAITLVVGVAVAMGFRSAASPFDWLAVVGVVTLLLTGLSWLATALGLQSKNPAGAASSTIGLLLLPYLSSGFVPADTMPGWLQAFARNQPMTPIGQTLRGLLIGTPVGHDGARVPRTNSPRVLERRGAYLTPYSPGRAGPVLVWRMRPQLPHSRGTVVGPVPP
jgi:ABC-2 type transport system permease protein